MPLPAAAPLAQLARAIGVRGFIAIGLAIALGIAMWRADAISADRDDLRDKLAVSEAQHAVTRASLATLERELAEMVRDGELRAERLAEAMDEQDERTAALKEQAERIAAEGSTDPCVTPEAVRGARGL